MAAVEVQLELDQPDRLRLGGRLTGTVVVTCRQVVHELVLSARLERTVRIGERTWDKHEGLFKVELDEPRVEGEVVRHPFDVYLPPGAPTAGGAHVEVSWTLVAVCAAGGEVERCAVPVVLGSGPEPAALEPTPFRPHRRRKVLGAVAVGAVVGLGPLAIVFAFAGLSGVDLLVSGILGAAPLTLSLPVAWWLDRRDRRYSVTLDAPAAVRRGTPLPVRVAVADQLGGELRSAVVQVVCTEWKQAPRSLVSHELVRAPRRLDRGDAFTAEATIDVPAGALPTVRVVDEEVDQEGDGLQPAREVPLIGHVLRLTVVVGRRRLVVERPLTVLRGGATAG